MTSTDDERNSLPYTLGRLFSGLSSLLATIGAFITGIVCLTWGMNYQHPHLANNWPLLSIAAVTFLGLILLTRRGK